MWLEERIIQSMGLIRILSGIIEITAAIFILRAVRVEQAVRINAVLGLVGPAILIIVTALGVAGLAARLPLSKLALLLSGVALILASTR